MNKTNKYEHFFIEKFFKKAVKKAYVEQLTDEVQKLVNENEELKAKLDRMKIHQEELERKLVNNETQLKSPEYECAVAIRNMMQTTIKSQTPEIVKEQVLKHATVNITTSTENDPFKYLYTEIGWE